MAKRAWLLVTPEMMNELYQFIRHRELWTVVDHPLPADIRFVGSKAAREGANYFLCESAAFDDLPPADWPELPRPRLMKQADYVRARLQETTPHG